MTVVKVFGSKMVLVTNPVGWSRKAMYLKSYPSGLLEGIGDQKEWRANFARAALGTWGHTGKATYKGLSMPRPAVEIASALLGRGFGRAAAKRRAAREAAHAAASQRWMGGPAPAAPVSIGPVTF
jgi:hypothetical protein